MKHKTAPPMPLQNWLIATRALSLEQKGLLVEALYWAWFEPKADIHLEDFRRVARVDPRKFSRLWTQETQAAFDDLRRARRRVDEADQLAVIAASGGRCGSCGCEITAEAGRANSMHIDHVTPVSKLGTSHRSNLMVLCRTCNLSKGARHGEA